MKNFSILILWSLISACASKPWVVIDGSKSKATDSNNYDVYITGVDGKLNFDKARVKNIEPGFHLLQLTSTKPDRKGKLTYANFPIITKPCTRYYVSAQHQSSLTHNNTAWQVVVLKEESLKRCEKLLKESNTDTLK